MKPSSKFKRALTRLLSQRQNSRFRKLVAAADGHRHQVWITLIYKESGVHVVCHIAGRKIVLSEWQWHEIPIRNGERWEWCDWRWREMIRTIKQHFAPA